ncbi:MAG: hypothetical protein RL748_2437 [Pseudomonadota bacterium]|jgi:SAM-dependent methyltransferase
MNLEPETQVSDASLPRSTPSAAAMMRNFLHVGCGRANYERLPVCFRNPGWREIRLDIDPSVRPDIVASITDLSMLPDDCVDAIWSSHNLEHLHSYEVPLALGEFMRVLKPNGFFLVNLPDLRAVAKQILADNLTRPMYMSEVGAITPLDVLFGHQRSLVQGKHYMAHRTGFTSTTLGEALIEAGFVEVRVLQGKLWDLWAIGLMPEAAPEILSELAGVCQ